MEELLDKKIGTLATENFAYVKVFHKYGLDFFCKGSSTLREAIENTNANQNNIINSLEDLENQNPTGLEVDVRKWPLDLLADYIQKTHHKFTENSLVNLRTLTEEFLNGEYPEKDIISKFQIPLEALAKELGAHMKREELILFPTIKRLVMARGKIEDPGAKTVKNPVDQMIHEHDTQFQLIKEIRELLTNYQFEENSSEKFQSIVSSMKELDEDLEIHLHLENNILFPKTVDLEKTKMN